MKRICCDVQSALGWILLFGNYSRVNAINSPYVLENIIVNSESLTVTSYHFNVNSKYSDWVSKIFGDKAVFYSSKESNQSFSSDALFSLDEIEQRQSITRRQVRLPAYAFWPECSIEMLAYVILDTDSPFKMEKKNINAMMGNAMLTLGNIQWECYYRTLYENWRNNADSDTKPNFWPVLFYCPTMNAAMCVPQSDRFEMKDKYSGSLLMRHPDSKSSYWRTDIFIERSVRKRRRKIPSVAVCTSIPYLSTDVGKQIANGALLYDWTRYYLNLGIQVFIYDRDGNFQDYLFNSAYAGKQLGVHGSTAAGGSNGGSHSLLSHPNLAYFNYTILGLLDTKSEKARYDNTQGLNDFLIKYDNDHALSLTQCRFEAKAVMGIDVVIVNDFDEFLYCPAGGANPVDQARYMRSFFAAQRAQGIDQISFYQRMLANRTVDNPRDCLVKHTIDKGKGSSIFDCFAPIQYTINEFLLKSVHLNHGCPMTGDHLACPLPDRDKRSHDCLCESVIAEDCSMYHLSSRVSDYEDARNTKHAPSLYEGQINELYLIANNIKMSSSSSSSSSSVGPGVNKSTLLSGSGL